MIVRIPPLAVTFVLMVLAGCQDLASQSYTVAAMEEAAGGRSPVVGQAAPDFTLNDHNDAPVTLSKQQGRWVVVYFYPKDDTPGCTCQATEFTELLFRFHRMKAEVYGISPDSTESHRAFIKRHRLALPLLSDPDHKVMAQYGAWVQTSLGERRYGRVIRTTMLIDPKGVIRYHWPEVIPKGHAERVRQKLEALQRAEKS